ncbi:MAG: putative lipid II flippase FtsW [Clostridia bacterium]|nr:putative lipid II flippase FtsW [Clostridia bacterium]
MALNKKRPLKHGLDYYFLFTLMALVVFGILMVFSASSIQAMTSVKDPYYFMKKQLISASLGLLAMYVAYRVDYFHLRRYAGLAIPLCLILLIAVLFTQEVKGAQSWIQLGSFNFQPSELAKLGVVLLMAKFLTLRDNRQEALKQGIWPALGVLGVTGFLILLQGDFGSTAVLMGVGVVMLFISGFRLIYLGGLCLMGLGAATFYIFEEGKEYRIDRFLAFMNPAVDSQGVGWQITNSLYAIGSGGLAGLGLGQSKQKFGWLPERHNDFIFSIIAEELGFIGAVLLITLFAILIFRGYRIALKAPDTFSSLLAAGITSIIMVEALINIAVVTGIMPVTGITLPFISYGGSSLIFKLLGMGVLLNISCYTKRNTKHRLPGKGLNI